MIVDHETLKNTASLSSVDDQYKRIYKVLAVEVGEDEGLYAEVQRISDRKKFTLPLADLKTVEKNSKNSQLLHDYAVWYANFR
ncbi:MAG: calcium-binding protein [Desulfobacterales bacterium]